MVVVVVVDVVARDCWNARAASPIVAIADVACTAVGLAPDTMDVAFCIALITGFSTIVNCVTAVVTGVGVVVGLGSSATRVVVGLGSSSSHEFSSTDDSQVCLGDLDTACGLWKHSRSRK